MRGREAGEGGKELRILVIMRLNKKAELVVNSDKKHFPNVYGSFEWPEIHIMGSYGSFALSSIPLTALEYCRHWPPSDRHQPH